MATFRKFLVEQIASKGVRLGEYLKRVTNPKTPRREGRFSSRFSDLAQSFSKENMTREKIREFLAPSAKINPKNLISADFMQNFMESVRRFTATVKDKVMRRRSEIIDPTKMFERELENRINAAEKDIISLSKSLADGRITAGQFRESLVSRIRKLHIEASFLGLQGVRNMTPNIPNVIIRRVSQQIRFIDRAIASIVRTDSSHQSLADRFIRAARHFSGAGRVTSQQVQRQALSDFSESNDQKMFEMRILGVENNCPSCFPAGSMVLAEDGWVDISTIKVNDRVMTSNGLANVVGKIHKMSNHLYTIRIGDRKIECTGDHIIPLADGRELQARDLSVGDDVMVYKDTFHPFQRNFFGPYAFYFISITNRMRVLSLVCLNGFNLSFGKIMMVLGMTMPPLSINFYNKKLANNKVVYIPTISYFLHVFHSKIIEYSFGFYFWLGSFLFARGGQSPFKGISLEEFWIVLHFFGDSFSYPLFQQRISRFFIEFYAYICRSVSDFRSSKFFWKHISAILRPVFRVHVSNKFIEFCEMRPTIFRRACLEASALAKIVFLLRVGIGAINTHLARYYFWFSTYAHILSSGTFTAKSASVVFSTSKFGVTETAHLHRPIPFYLTFSAYSGFMGFTRLSNLVAIPVSFARWACRAATLAHARFAGFSVVPITQITYSHKYSPVDVYTIGLDHTYNYIVNSVKVNNCPDLAGYWVPIGTLPAIGQGTECGMHCNCRFVYFQGPEPPDDTGFG